MALTVNTNVAALNAQRHTADSQLEMANAMERLASGKRINSARDDAAGLAITARMESQISGLAQAVRNSNDAISLVQTAEGALQETTDILQRIRELAIQSAGGAPSNADRVNLHKEVEQLQEELGRIANTTRFNGEILLNGTFHDKDFQIGQTNNEEISVSIGDLRPEKIGAYTQTTVANVGLIGVGADVDDIHNGVNQQTLVIAVGDEVPRTVSITQGQDARTISDALNQAGAQFSTRATTTLDVYVDGTGAFSFDISSSATPELQDTVTVGATAASQASTMAAEINAGYASHGISAEMIIDDGGEEFVRLYQDQGYDIRFNDFITTGSSSLDLSGDGEIELTGAYGATAAIAGGSLIMDAPASFLLSSDDQYNTILQGSRATLSFEGVSSDPTIYQDTTFDVTVSGTTYSIDLGAAELGETIDAVAPVMTMEFVADSQTQGSSGAQIGAMRPAGLAIGLLDTTTTTAVTGDATTRFSLNINGGGADDFDMAQALYDLGYDDSETVSAADFVTAMQTTIDANALYAGNNKVTVSLTDYGQIQLDVAGGTGSIVFAEHSATVTAATDGLADTLTGTVRLEDDSTVDLDLGTAGATESVTSGGTLILGSAVNTLYDNDYGPVNPFGLDSTGTSPANSMTISSGNSNQTFTLAINGSATTTTITVADGTYYAMEELATAVQAGIDDSVFAQTGDFPITVAATQDSNGDWGLTFASEAGHSIEFGPTDSDGNINGGFLDSNGLGILDVSSAPNAADSSAAGSSPFDEGKHTIGTISVVSGDDTGDQTTRFALNVNGGGYDDFDMAQALTDLGYTSSGTVTSADFVTAMQATIDANELYTGDNAVTVSLTTEGLINLAVAGGTGSIGIREHSSYYATDGSGTNGLVDTLTGTVSSEDDSAVDLDYGTGGAIEAVTSGGSLTLGQTVNDLEITAGNNASATGYVKPFGIQPLVISSGTNDTISFAVNRQSGATEITIDAGTYFNMSEIAAAIQDALDNDAPSLNLTATAVQDSSNDRWGLTFASNDGYQIEAWGDFLANTMSVYGDDAATAVDASSVTSSPTNALTIAEVTGAATGPSGYRLAVDAGAYSNGIDLSEDNIVSVEVLDNATGEITSVDVTLGTDSGSLSFADYMTYLEDGLNADSSLSAAGFGFSATGSDTSYSMTFEPAGDYTVTLSGSSITQAFGESVTATGEAATDGVTFDSMDEVVSAINTALEAEGAGVAVSYSRGGDTFTFTVTEGASDASSTLTLSGDDLVLMGISGALDAIGGGTESTETVRYVSQIDISTRDSALLAMTVVDAALESIAANRAGLGAVANRLESTIANLLNISENTAASLSRVMDADFAAESTRLARAQILQEASVAMLAQANAAGQSVLKLLQ